MPLLLHVLFRFYLPLFLIPTVKDKEGGNTRGGGRIRASGWSNYYSGNYNVSSNYININNNRNSTYNHRPKTHNRGGGARRRSYR